MDSDCISVESLCVSAIRIAPDVLLVDCRSTCDYDQGHLQGAISLSFPAILWRRILMQKSRPGCLDEFLMCDSKVLVQRHQPNVSVVLYDEDTFDINDCPTGNPMRVLCEILQLEQTTRFSFLKGGFHCVQLQRPELIVSTYRALPPRPAISSAPSPFNQDNLFSSLSFIWGFMAIGSQATAQDLNFLNRENITHVLNLTACDFKPEVFTSRICMQIKLNDSPAQDILSHIPAAVAFIQSARDCGGRILIHCLAGISRSSAIAIAYIMWHGHHTFPEAYDIVRTHRPCASPNLNFMGQLTMFGKCLCFNASTTSSPAQAALLASVCLRKSPAPSPTASGPLGVQEVVTH